MSFLEEQMIRMPSTHPPLACQFPLEADGKDAIGDDWQLVVGFMISATSATSRPPPPPPLIRRM